MKKTLLLVSSVILSIALLGGCGKTDKKLNSLEKIKEAGKITVGLDDSYPPMEFRDKENKLVGFDIDLGNEIGKKLGVKTEYTTTDFNGILLALNSGKFDVIISGLSITDKRKEAIDFSEPYVMGGQVIAVNKNNNTINKLSDLKDKTIGCQLGSTGDKAATEIKGLKEIKRYDKITEAFHELIAGRIDAVIMDAQVGGYYISKEKDKYKVLEETVSKEPMGIGFKKEDKELKEAVQKALNELKEDGTLSKLSIKWFGFDAYKK
ncbi:amino acid ABC transporter substrate-binding protein [Clostridium sporogenes]|uniref:Amino acid ABC transporter substrate-binding protein n=1 Tax=Clostridium sporogenes TaxID=1509 RepID=A0ABD6RRS7_CLOSG|nr:ABC transporter substrate-binding protein [Clostridium sporogenes]EKS4342167.1 amino acid ABC transporter substrate-binding protein [Clostridium botulinum]EKS4393634.1 amino acid ABC transporter substrate-binding protein [Clostridium botulinum]MCW6078986.1 ABC transporter substrate-binding protein [Clostridium sporogenes]OSB18512.1 amino acid ABC transporter substrate-binding protein [Clostridium sporogenes]